jgi:hypothetical protein
VHERMDDLVGWDSWVLLFAISAATTIVARSQDFFCIPVSIMARVGSDEKPASVIVNGNESWSRLTPRRCLRG